MFSERMGVDKNIVDGGNPAPPGMYKALQIMGKTTYELVQDFLHQQYGSKLWYRF